MPNNPQITSDPHFAKNESTIYDTWQKNKRGQWVYTFSKLDAQLEKMLKLKRIFRKHSLTK